MRPLATATMPAADSMSWWLWPALSIGSDILILACLAGLWRTIAAAQRPDPILKTDPGGPASAQEEMLSRAKAELARNLESLRLSAELPDVGVWFWDMLSGVIEWSDRCRIHLSLPPGRTPTMEHFYSVIHPDDRERVRAAVDRSIKERQEYHAAYRVVRSDGTERRLATMGRAWYDTNLQPISMGGATLDITQFAKVEDAIKTFAATSTCQASELEAERRRFQLFSESVSDVVMETDREGIVRWITPSVKLRIGRTPDEMVGRHFRQLVHPDETDRLRSMEAQVTRGASAESELRLRIADDGYQWFLVSIRPLFDARRRLVGRLCGWRDIHREVQIREAVAAERHRLRATLTGMLDPFVIFQPVRDDGGQVADFVSTDANPAACTWLGTDRERLVGATLVDFYPEVVPTGLLRHLIALADTGHHLTLDDFPFPQHGVGPRRIDVRGVRVDGWITIVWRDVTERHDAAEKMAASEEQFRLLAENSFDVVMRTDRKDTLLWTSPSLTPVLGFAAADCIGKSVLEFLATDESRSRYARDKSRVLAGQGAVTRLQIRNASGDIHWAEVHSSPYRNPEGRIDGMVSSTRLIDAEIRATEALEHRAHTDDLTQLLTRDELMARLEALVTHLEGQVAVLWCDIDQFKAINDAHGHAAGDIVLKTLADRIRGCLRRPDEFGGRIGGDELMVVLLAVEDVDDASIVAEQLRRAAAQPIPFDGMVLQATISIGVTLALPVDTLDDLLARADDAMYRAKNDGKNRVVAIPEPVPPAPLPTGRV